nr:PREDICTED: uncharacterized protein LOC105669384 isoform X1 [Linepithema humile]
MKCLTSASCLDCVDGIFVSCTVIASSFSLGILPQQNNVSNGSSEILRTTVSRYTVTAELSNSRLLKMVRCVVKCCKNTREICATEQVSFFQLPENPIMREGWIQRIGEIHLPTNIKNARICSAHFTEDSFLKGKRNHKNRDGIRRRKLIPSAVPTLLLSSMENSIGDTVRMNCKVIYKDFLLPVKTCMKERSITEMDSGNQWQKNLCKTIASVVHRMQGKKRMTSKHRNISLAVNDWMIYV